MDIITETINRIRLSDGDLILLYRILKKINKSSLNLEEKKFYKIILARVEGRLKIKEIIWGDKNVC